MILKSGRCNEGGGVTFKRNRRQEGFIKMPHIISIENSDALRRQLSEKLKELAKNGWPLNGKYEAQTFGTWQKLFEQAATPDIFAAREVIVIEGADSLGDFPEDLTSLIEDDKAPCIIILPGIDQKYLKPIKNLITEIKKEPEVKPWDRPKWLVALAKDAKFKLAYDAAQLLTDSIESQEELRSEIDKLALYSGGREVKLEDVEKISFDEGGRAMLIFLDGVCAANPGDVARALKYLRAEPLLPYLAALTNRLRPALMLSLFAGRNSDEAIKILGTKNYALKKAQAALKNFGPKKIQRFMTKAARLSFLEKTGRAEGWPGFELILWEMF